MTSYYDTTYYIMSCHMISYHKPCGARRGFPLAAAPPSCALRALASEHGRVEHIRTTSGNSSCTIPPWKHFHECTSNSLCSFFLICHIYIYTYIYIYIYIYILNRNNRHEQVISAPAGLALPPGGGQGRALPGALADGLRGPGLGR